MTTRAWWAVAALLAFPAPVPAQQVPEAVLHRSAESVDKATRSISSLQADYIRSFNVYGRANQMTEEGRLFVRRTPEGKVYQRWEGKDEKGPVLTLVRDRDFTVWRGKKKEIGIPVTDPCLHHPAKFGFPFLPADYKSRFVIGPPFVSPEFDDRWPKQMTGGIPIGLTFGPREGNERYTFKLVTFLYEEKLGLPYRYRCDTYGWQLELVDCDNWVINPELPAALFEPPDKLAGDPAPAAPPPASGDKTPAK